MNSKFILISICLDKVAQDVIIESHHFTLVDLIVEYVEEFVLPYHSLDIESISDSSASELITYFEMEFEGLNSDIKYSIHVLDSTTDKYVKLSKQMIREFINLNYDLIKDNLLKKMYDSGNYK